MRNASITNANKVARVTFLFWVMKIIATTLGETLGDEISMTLGLGYIAGIGITSALLAAALLWQLAATRYVPLRFWAVIVGTTTLGTEVSDALDRTLHLGYAGGSALLAAGLALVLWRWCRRYGHLQVHPIAGRGKEILFWAAVLLSNSLGTAFGDLLCDDLGLTYGHAALVTGALIGLVLLLHAATRINAVLLFWVAFIFTRPFGATFGDLLTKPLRQGGLDLGTLPASLVCLVLLAALVLAEHRAENRRPVQ